MSIIKTKEEIEKLRKAAELGDQCFEFICNWIHIGMTEKNIAKKIDDFMKDQGADGTSFDTIVGSGSNSSFIHSTPSEREIAFGDIILLDYGCVLDGYCSDTSRTIFLGEVKPEYQEIYEIVLKAQKVAIEKICVGMTGKEADEVARKVIQSYGYDFNHALGHGVGKIVHDELKISPKGEEVLKEGMVFSIEPGIYIENKFGVRIEDVVVMKNGRVELLSHASKEIRIVK